MPSLPSYMKSLLHNFDRDLRLRWSDAQNRWRLERKVSRGVMWPPSELETPSAMEDRRSASEGYILVSLIEHNALSDRLIPVLRQSDIWSNGGAEAVADAMDRMDTSQKYLMRQMVLDYAEAKARERFRYMNTVRTVPEKQAHSAPAGGMSINGGA